MKTLGIAALIAVALSNTFAQTTNSAASRSDFVLDKNKAFVYLLFERIGNGPRYADNEPATRIWFSFVNNCRVPITVQTFGTPRGSAVDEVGLIHKVVENTLHGGVASVSLELSAPVSRAKQPSSPDKPVPERVQMPLGYEAEVSSSALIQPNKSLLFSIPITHLSRDWHLEIPFEFELPGGKCCRPPNVGGEPQMSLFYFDSDLPEEIQQKLPRKK